MCWYCGEAITDREPIGRSQRCLNCGKDLRACKNCKFFLPGDGCRESGTEFQADRERGNFCDWFALAPKFRGGSLQSGEKEKAETAKTAFNNLFS